jgi:hypothetical protein
MASEKKDTVGVSPSQESGGEDLLQSLLGQLVQDAIEREFAKHIGAGPWERTSRRRRWRNGSKKRRLKTRVGNLELRVPKDREGRFQPSLFARYQHSERALVLDPSPALCSMSLRSSGETTDKPALDPRPHPTRLARRPPPPSPAPPPPPALFSSSPPPSPPPAVRSFVPGAAPHRRATYFPGTTAPTPVRFPP